VYEAFEDARLDVEALSASLPALYLCKGRLHKRSLQPAPGHRPGLAL